MNRTLVIRISAVALLLTGAWVAYTQNNTKQTPSLMIHKIQNDLYWIEGDGGNVAVYITGDGVILVDDKYVADYDQIVANVKSVTNQPIKYILSTHHHADHSGGNTKFASTVEIISTVNAHNNIVNKLQSNAPDGMVPARVTFTQESDVFLGGKQVRAIYMGRGHTNGDAVIYFPALRTLHTGDLMAGTTPLIDYPGGGSLAQWPTTLDEAMKLDFDTVIPGHGQITNKAGLKTYRDNVAKEITRVRGLIKEGKNQDEVAKVMTAEYGWMPGSLNMQWSLPGMMTELK
ncbi:MAG TPA: MBL fold metallo-hydrolase [Bryobacteraceae bacterium]|jgi:glyoxylase-like metal-dependent hydrolase (beta-lactamase superfamily II)